VTATLGVAIGIGIDRKQEPSPGRDTDDICHEHLTGWPQRGNDFDFDFDTDFDTDTEKHSFIRDHPKSAVLFFSV
jgi:hypothetical protein